MPAYIWDGKSENPYFGLLSLGEVIIVTSDSMSMMSEACSTGKPVYIYEMPSGSGRQKQFVESLIQKGCARPFSGRVEIWKNEPLEETRKAADFVIERYEAKIAKFFAAG